MVGEVLDETTNLPLRLALVRLVPVPVGPEPVAVDPATLRPGMSFQPEVRLESVAGMSGLDGSFSLGHVPTGDYYALAMQLGYLAPGGLAFSNGEHTPEEWKRLAAALPTVHVGEGQTATLHLTARRGASVSGQVRFADGSPMVGAKVSCEPLVEPVSSHARQSRQESALQRLVVMGETQHDLVTDDQGRFHVYGLPPGKYVLSTGIALDQSAGHVMFTGGGGAQTSGREHMFPEMIPVYGTSAFRRKDAKVIELGDGSSLSGVDVVVDLEGLHTIRGKILAKGDSQAPGALIEMREDVTRNEERIAEAEEDGSFQFNYVPPGSYTLKVTASNRANLPPDSMPEKITFYNAVKLPAVVGDHDVVLPDAVLIPLKPGEQPNWTSAF